MNNVGRFVGEEKPGQGQQPEKASNNRSESKESPLQEKRGREKVVSQAPPTIPDTIEKEKNRTEVNQKTPRINQGG